MSHVGHTGVMAQVIAKAENEGTCQGQRDMAQFMLTAMTRVASHGKTVPRLFFQKSPVFVWLFLQKNPRNGGSLHIVATSIRLIRILTTGPWQLVSLGSSIDCGQMSCVCVCVCVCGC